MEELSRRGVLVILTKYARFTEPKIPFIPSTILNNEKLIVEYFLDL